MSIRDIVETKESRDGPESPHITLCKALRLRFPKLSLLKVKQIADYIASEVDGINE